MMPFFRYVALHTPVFPIVLFILFLFVILQGSLSFPDTTSSPALWRCLIPGMAQADVAAEFNEKFDALIPPENSSVHSDYLFEQIALGSRYTVMQLEQIREQDAANSQRFQKLSEQLDTLIEQNQQIIELLENQKDL